MRLRTLNKMLVILQTRSLQLNQTRTLQNNPASGLLRGFQEPAWSVDRVQLVTQAITRHLEFTVRHNSSVSAQVNKQLLVVKFAHHALDQVAISRILNDSVVVASIPAHYRKKVGRPQVAFKYDDPIGTSLGPVLARAAFLCA